MQGVVDFHGRFMDVIICWPGKVHDALVLMNSSFYTKNNNGNTFPDCNRNIGEVDVPLIVLGNETYPDRRSLSIKEQQFNYRQSGECLWMTEGKMEMSSQKNGLLLN